MTRSSLKHLLLVSSLALGMVFGAPNVFPAKAGCGCGGTAGGTPPAGSKDSDRSSKTPGWKNVKSQAQQDKNAAGPSGGLGGGNFGSGERGYK